MSSSNLRRKKVCQQSRTPSQVMSPCSRGAACSSQAVRRYLGRGMESRQGQQIGQRAPSFSPSPRFCCIFVSPLSSKSSSLSSLYKLSDLMAEATAPLLVHGVSPFPSPTIKEAGFTDGQHLAEVDTTVRLHFHFSLYCTGEGNGNPLQCSCLENPKNGGAWWAAIYGVAQSDMAQMIRNLPAMQET